MKKRFIFYLLSSLLVFPLTGFAENHATILQQTNSGLIYRLAFKTPTIDTLEQNRTEKLRIRFQEQTGIFNYQNQLYPEQTTVLAVPPVDRPINVTLLNAQWRSVETKLPLQHGLPDQPINEEINTVGISGTGWMGDLRIAQIRTIPLRFFNGEWQYLTSAEIQVSWPAFQPIADNFTEQTSVSGRAVLNAEAINQFTRRRAQSTLLKRSQQTGREFVRMEVESNGIYRISGAMLTQAGVAISSLDQDQIRMYNGGGRPLPEGVTAERSQSLIEIPIIVQDGGDGQINSTDTILFFGQSVNDWEYSDELGQWVHYTNPYETKNVYWLSWDAQASAAKRFQVESASAGTTVQHGLHLHSIENDLLKIMDSGRDWYDNPLSPGDFENFEFTFINPRRSSAKIRLRMVADDVGSPNTLGLRLNNSTEQIFSFNSSSGSSDGYKVISSTIRSFQQLSTETSGSNTMQVQFKNTVGSAKTYVDWIELMIDDSLHAQGGELSFANNPDDAVRTFSASDFSSEPIVMEIS
ncbi:MAG: hypothetical protein DWQ10_01850, partial [Calditrichaeota bacterium]